MMRIIIKEIVDQTQGYTINFATEYGNASALWRGNQPKIHHEYIVEFEIPDVLCWQKDIVSTEEKYSIGTENNKFCLTGLLESIEDDGYAIIRIGDDIVPIETQGEPPALDTFVKLTTNTLFLYEVSY